MFSRGKRAVIYHLDGGFRYSERHKGEAVRHDDNNELRFDCSRRTVII